MLRTLVCILSAITRPAAAELPASASLFGEACVQELGADDFARKNTDDLARAITLALDQKILTPSDLGRHYVAGTRGLKLRHFISYITKQLNDQVTVHAVGRGRSSAEVAFQNQLDRIRKDALAFGERHPDGYRRLAKAWQVRVRKVALAAVGLNPAGRGSLEDALAELKPVQ